MTYNKAVEQSFLVLRAFDESLQHDQHSRVYIESVFAGLAAMFEGIAEVEILLRGRTRWVIRLTKPGNNHVSCSIRFIHGESATTGRDRSRLEIWAARYDTRCNVTMKSLEGRSVAQGIRRVWAAYWKMEAEARCVVDDLHRGFQMASECAKASE